MRVVTINTPRSEYPFGKAILAGSADVVHDLVATFFNDCFSDSCRDRIERFIPGGAFPLSFAAFARPFQWIKDAIWISYLVKCCRTFGAVATARTGVFRIALELGKQTARRFAVEAGGGNEGVASFYTLGPGLGIEFGPIVPTFFRREGCEMDSRWARVEGFVVSHVGLSGLHFIDTTCSRRLRVLCVSALSWKLDQFTSPRR